MIIKPDDLVKTGGHYARINNYYWSVSRLIDLTKDFKVKQIPIEFLDLRIDLNIVSIRELARHINQVNKADIQYPIILDQDGVLMDGRHRITKAIIEGKEKIPGVRFEINPHPCKVGS